MKFGKVDDPSIIDFTLPADHEGTARVPATKPYKGVPNIYVGCAKWNRQDLKNFYPRGTKDELSYYASQFNCIEMNASFYRNFSTVQFEKWRDKVPDDFRFFPKVYQAISHWRRLKDVEEEVKMYLHGVEHLHEKLGMVFLQMIHNFKPNEENMDRLRAFCALWPDHIPLAIELRHTDWYNDDYTATELYTVLERHNIANIITDTAGRRDLLHMRLTSNTAFVRYVGANHASDYTRATDWVDRLEQWVEQGIENIYFFVHQNNEVESVNISRHLIRQLNERLDIQLKLPNTLDTLQSSLF